MARYKIDPYLFSEEEKTVLKSLVFNHTPLKISQTTGIPRATVYFLLNKLKTRGLVICDTKGNKKIWTKRENTEVNQANYTNYADGIDSNTEADSAIKTYSNKDELNVFLDNVTKPSRGRLSVMNGDSLSDGWNRNVGGGEIIKFNERIQENNIVSDLISSKEPLNEHVKYWGEEWVSSFNQKPTEYHIIDEKFLKHKAQIFIKDNKVYLVNMSKPLVIEIADPEIEKMFSLLFEYIKTKSKKVNIKDYLESIKI